jgi:hypothetical protein
MADKEIRKLKAAQLVLIDKSPSFLNRRPLEKTHLTAQRLVVQQVTLHLPRRETRAAGGNNSIGLAPLALGSRFHAGPRKKSALSVGGARALTRDSANWSDSSYFRMIFEPMGHEPSIGYIRRGPIAIKSIECPCLRGLPPSRAASARQSREQPERPPPVPWPQVRFVAA